MNGIINFYKPKGMTSHDAVSFFRKLLNIKRIGHTGTLDPNVTGVLPICIGKATRVSEYILQDDKEYIGELSLGEERDTQDMDGKLVNKSDRSVSKKEIEEVFSRYKGEIHQIPPMYSAVRHKGKKLYELAREGKMVERKPRKITIYDLDIMSISEDNKKIMFYTHCSKGSYMRTLCHDIGNELGTYGHMSYLIRIGVGPYNLNNSYGIDYLKLLNKEEILELMLPIDSALKNLKKINVPAEHYDRIINGARIIMKDKNIIKNVDLRVYCREEFIGIGKIIKSKNNNNILQMTKVFI